MLKALAAFGDGGNVTCRNPPEAVNGLVHFFEPLGAVAQDSGMVGPVDVVAKRFEGLPDGHVEQNGSILRVVDDVRGIAGRGLQAPEEAGSIVGESVNRVELSDKFGDLGIVDGSEKTPNVNLRKVIGHGALEDASFALTVAPQKSAPDSRHSGLLRKAARKSDFVVRALRASSA